jgi:catechol 2,3-dioxygenase-like lactoylglutathione lyase family enzyme
MQLGNFSVSLAVKDLATSRAFYEKLGFRSIAGVAEQGWLILQNETSTIGLFQGMFPKNMLTFNPGWDRSSQTLPEFQDVRELQAKLKERGIAFDAEADAGSTGPASFLITDPDGNPILVDQHVARPAR